MEVFFRIKTDVLSFFCQDPISNKFNNTKYINLVVLDTFCIYHGVNKNSLGQVVQ